MQKYPKLVYENKAICKTISILPAGFKSTVPAVYLRALPVVIGVVTIFAIFVVPASRHSVVSNSQNALSHLHTKNQELVANLSFSLRAGITAYTHQVEDSIKILPIDSRVEPRVYGGRVGKQPIEINRVVIVENMHAMTANLSEGFSLLK